MTTTQFDPIGQCPKCKNGIANCICKYNHVLEKQGISTTPKPMSPEEFIGHVKFTTNIGVTGCDLFVISEGKAHELVTLARQQAAQEERERIKAFVEEMHQKLNSPRERYSYVVNYIEGRLDSLQDVIESLTPNTNENENTETH